MQSDDKTLAVYSYRECNIAFWVDMMKWIYLQKPKEFEFIINIFLKPIDINNRCMCEDVGGRFNSAVKE